MNIIDWFKKKPKTDKERLYELEAMYRESLAVAAVDSEYLAYDILCLKCKMGLKDKKKMIIQTEYPSAVIAKAETEIKKRKGRMGDDFFDVKGFEGRWRHVPEGIEITITDMPMWASILSDETIESKVREYFSAST